MDDRTKLIADHVKQVHNPSDSQCNSNPNPSHTHHHHCEHCYDYEPIRCRSTVVIALFAYAGHPAETMRNPWGGTTSSFTASEGTSYAHIHVLIHSYSTIPISSSHSSFSCRPSTLHSRPSAHSYHHASSRLPPGHSFSPPSLLHSTLQRTFPYPIPTLFRSSRPHIFPHASRPAASLRRASHSRKSQSHIFQVFSEDLGPWPCFVPSVSMYRVWSGLSTGRRF